MRILSIQQQQEQREVAARHVVHALTAAKNHRRDEDAGEQRVAVAAGTQPEHGEHAGLRGPEVRSIIIITLVW